MHHLRKNQYPSAPKRSRQKAPPATDVPRNNQFIIRKAFVPTVRPQPLPAGSAPGFRFLHLPAELRNLVYSFCLPADEYTIIQSGLYSRKLKETSAKGLIAVCKQIRNEFRPMYWSVHGPMIHRYELASVMDVFFSESSNDNVVPARVSLIYYNHVAGTAAVPGDMTYDLLPLVKSQKRLAGDKWQIIPGSIPGALQAGGVWMSYRPLELGHCLRAIVDADWHGMLAKTPGMTLESFQLCHSVKLQRNRCSIKLQMSKERVSEEESKALEQIPPLMVEAMLLPNVPPQERYSIVVQVSIFNVNNRRAWQMKMLL